jgi:hypothetical protein
LELELEACFGVLSVFVMWCDVQLTLSACPRVYYRTTPNRAFVTHAGLNFEHTLVDGHTVLRFASDIFTETVTRFAKTINGKVQSLFESSAYFQESSQCESDGTEKEGTKKEGGTEEEQKDNDSDDKEVDKEVDLKIQSSRTARKLQFDIDDEIAMRLRLAEVHHGDRVSQVCGLLFGEKFEYSRICTHSEGLVSIQVQV